MPNYNPYSSPYKQPQQQPATSPYQGGKSWTLNGSQWGGNYQMGTRPQASPVTSTGSPYQVRSPATASPVVSAPTQPAFRLADRPQASIAEEPMESAADPSMDPRSIYGNRNSRIANTMNTSGANINAISGIPAPGAASTQPPGLDASSLPYVDQYLNPYMKYVTENITNAVNANNSARGLLNSSRTGDDIMQQLAPVYANAWQQAFQNYTNDRDFGSGRMDKAFEQWYTQNRAGRADYQDDRNFGYRGYQDQVSAYNNLMANRQQVMADLAAGGPKMAQAISQIALAFGFSEAEIATAIAQVQAELASAQGQNNSGLLGSFGEIIGSLFGGE